MAKNKSIDFGKMGWTQRAKWAAKAVFGLKEVSLTGFDPERPEDFGFRRITARSDKELSPAKWQKQMAVAHFLWLQNPMAFRLLELLADFIIGSGFGWEAKDEEVSKIIDRHWTDPDNAWDLLQFDRYIEFSLFGVFSPRVFVNPHNGHVKLCPVDPALIKDIVPDKDIAGKADRIQLLRPLTGGDPNDLKVIREDRDPKSETTGLLVGDIFYFAKNKLTFLLQGTSDIFRVADWIDAFDQFIFSLLERIQFLNAHLYDVELEGAEQDEVDQRVDQLNANPPKPGSFRVHNEKEKWTALAPKINAAEVEAVAKIIKNLILGSMGIPEAWFGEGGETNRATLGEQAGPLHRKAQRMQAQWVEVLRSILQFQVDQAIIAKRLTRIKPDGTKRDLSFKILPSDISAKDMLQFIEGLDKLTTTLGNAVAETFISREKAAELWSAHASESGVEVEAPSKEDLAKNEQAEDEKAAAKEQEVVEEPYKDLIAKKNGAQAPEKTPAGAEPGGDAK